jgi:C_GCAxxG_C_C family probable redox protein
LSFKEYLGIRGALLPKLATGFGGGIGRKGSLCGAFTGSIMAIGMKMGRTDPKDKKAVLKIYGKCQQFWDRFEKEFGSNICYNITKYHLDNEKERQKWLDEGGPEKCKQIVKRTAQMLCKFLGKPTRSRNLALTKDKESRRLIS